jgi:diguanylate cyclase (GGDEF)-like protein
MIDIDHFKKINDSCGHQVGDMVLKSFAALVTKTVRESDVVCRYGGEELLIILPHTSAEAAFHVAENLRVKVQENDFRDDECSCDCSAVHVTASFGVTTLCSQIDTLHKLLGQADKALYFAKKQGRNKTVSCADLEDTEKCEET